MTATGSPAAETARHPWLCTFVESPQRAFDDLIEGRAAIAPFRRADAPDSAVQLFGGLDAFDPALRALAGAIPAWLTERQHIRLPHGRGERRRSIRQIAEAFEIIWSLSLTEAALWCFERRVRLNVWLAGYIDGPDRDARLSFLEMLAQMQPKMDGSADMRALGPLWQDIWEKSGSDLPDYYLQVGLLGLRRLPKAEGESDVSAWLAGLFGWAVSQNVGEAALSREWLYLKRLHPRGVGVWRKEVSRLLSQTRFAETKDFLLGWLACDPDLKALLRQDAKWEQRAWAPGPEECESLIGVLQTQGFEKTIPRIHTFVRQHETFARGTGVTEYLTIGITRVGRALIECRELPALKLAEELAREALRWGENTHVWALWADALEARGALHASEVIRREAIRRFPFSLELRVQLAEYLIAVARVSEAREVIERAHADGLKNTYSQAVHIRLLAHTKGIDVAREALQLVLQEEPHVEALIVIARAVERGELPWLTARRYEEYPPRNAELEDVLDCTLVSFESFARMRRLSDALEIQALHDAAAIEVLAILQNEPEFAYARLLAARHAIWTDEVESLADLPAAFERALREEDRALMKRVAENAPKLQALTLVARALFGDDEAAAIVDEWVRSSEAEQTSAGAAGLSGWIARQMRISEGVVCFKYLAQIRSDRILRCLKLANEAMVVDDLLVA